jgi:predicted N-acetyltransferase YhbS
MADMLCSLIRLPALAGVLAPLREQGITVRRPNSWEQAKVRAFIEAHFSVGWADEVSVAFHSRPVTCFVAMHDKEIVGFAAYECTRRNYFGPTGVSKDWERRGIGKALLLAALHGLQDLGYTYAVIGSVSSVEYYEKTVGAVVIPFENGDGIYRLKEDPKFLSL